MIDHPSQLAPLASITSANATTTSSPSSPRPSPPLVFLKIDTSYGRAGVPPHSPACATLIDAVLAAEQQGTCILHGVYSHAGHSYAAREGAEDVLGYLADEFRGLAAVARLIVGKRREQQEGRQGATAKGRDLVLSVGATPTATVVQQAGFMDGGSAGGGVGGGGKGGQMGVVEKLVEELRGEGFLLEVHAGV